MNVHVPRFTTAGLDHNVALLRDKLVRIAGDTCPDELGEADMEGVLAALPRPARRRAALLLRGAQTQAELTGNRPMLTAATYTLALAGEVWAQDGFVMPDVTRDIGGHG